MNRLAAVRANSLVHGRGFSCDFRNDCCRRKAYNEISPVHDADNNLVGGCVSLAHDAANGIWSACRCYWTLMVKTSECVVPPLVSVITALVMPSGVPPLPPAPLLPPLPQLSTTTMDPKISTTKAASRRS